MDTFENDVLVGQKFGNLTIKIEYGCCYGKPVRYVRCICGCGKVINRQRDLVITGIIKSCGCVDKDINAKAGKKKKYILTPSGETLRAVELPEYMVWAGLKRRCKRTDMKRYGGRGISVCKEWAESFEAFYNDMGKRPSDKHSIDRINNDGNYCKDNCRWATSEDQANNRSTNVFVEWDGELITLANLAKRYNLKTNVLHSRLKLGKYTINEALATPFVRK